MKDFPLEGNALRSALFEIFSASPNFQALSKEERLQVVDKIATTRDRKAFLDLVNQDETLKGYWSGLKEGEKRKVLQSLFGKTGVQEAYMTPIEPYAIGAVTRSIPMGLSALATSFLGEIGKQVYEAQTGKEAPWFLAPVIDFLGGLAPSVGKHVAKQVVQAIKPPKLTEEGQKLVEAVLQAKKAPVQKTEQVAKVVQEGVSVKPEKPKAVSKKKAQQEVAQQPTLVERAEETLVKEVEPESLTVKIAPETEAVKALPEATVKIEPEVLTLKAEPEETLTKIDVEPLASKTVPEEVIKTEPEVQKLSDEVQLPERQMEIVENAEKAELVVNNYTDKAVGDVSKDVKFPSEMFTANPVRMAWESLRTLDKAIGKLTGKLKDTWIDRKLRFFADIEGFRVMSRSAKDEFLKKAHYPQMGKIAEGDAVAEELSKLADEVQQSVGSEIVVRYLEDPIARDVIRLKTPQLADQLQKVADEIAKNSEDLTLRGIIKPSQHAKWGDRYLSRIYLNQEEAPVEITSGAKKIKVEKGRVIESIMDLPEDARKSLGFVEDARLLVARTIAKQKWNLALDDYFRQAVLVPEVVHPEATRFLVHNTFKDLGISGLEKLPDVMSPEYARKVIAPWIEDFLRRNNLLDRYKPLLKQFKQTAEQLAEELDGYKPPTQDYIKLDKTGFGVLSGLPVNRDVYNVIAGLRRILHPEEMVDQLDKWASTVLAIFKFMKVPANVGTYFRNFLSNIYQWSMSGADPTASIPYFVRALKELRSNGEYYKKARELGLLQSNFASEEIIKVLKELRADDRLLVRLPHKVIEKISNVYGGIDDVWKIARYMYAVEREKLPDVEAVLTAQRTHYDYALTYSVIKTMREAQLNSGKGVLAKVAGTMFPTFTQKTIGFLYESLLDRPATTALLLTAPLLIKDVLEDQMRQKYGKKYELAKRALPDYHRGAYNVALMDDEGNLSVVNLQYVLPFGGVAEFTRKMGEAIKGHPLEDRGVLLAQAFEALGFGQNPIVDTLQFLDTGKDPMTGKPISSVEFFAKTFAPQTLVSVWASTQSQTRSPAEAMLGYPVFTYKNGVWQRMLAGERNKIIKQIGEREGELRSKYVRGAISKEEYVEEVKRLRTIKKELMLELFNANPKEEEVDEGIN